jgi:hypothetical protein
LAIPFISDLITDLDFKSKDEKLSNDEIIVKEGFLNNIATFGLFYKKFKTKKVNLQNSTFRFV